MTEHLRPEEFVDAIDASDHAVSQAARAHLAACEACRRELADLRAVMQDTGAVEADAPSPLFWHHFSERVRAATAAVPVREPWWQTWSRPAAVIGAAVAAVAVAIALQPRALAPLAPIEIDGVASPMATVAMTDALDDSTWGLVVGLASELQYVDVKEAAEPRAGTVDAVIDELTPAQRTALARLLEKEMGEQ